MKITAIKYWQIGLPLREAFRHELTAAYTDVETVKGGADALIRQARLLDRLMTRYTQLTLSPGVRRGWDQLRAEITRITVTDSSLERDTIR